jgi:hypothetical protein
VALLKKFYNKEGTMAIDHRGGEHIVAHPGEVVGATDPGQPETREGHDSTTSAELARHASRRRFLQLATGASALFLVGGGGLVFAATRNNGETNSHAPTHPNVASPTPEALRAFENNLTMNTMALPESLNADTFPDITANIAEAIQYAVNKGDAPLLRRLIPGGLTGTTGTLQPGQFELRAAFIKGFRGSSQGTIKDNPDDPQNERYYAWGFKMELLEPISHLHAKPGDVTSFRALVRITMGDLPPLPTLTTNELGMEPPKTLDVEVELTRYAINNAGEQRNLHNIVPAGNGGWKETKEKGWALASVGQMYAIPDIMARNHADHGFTQVPELFKKS